MLYMFACTYIHRLPLQHFNSFIQFDFMSYFPCNCQPFQGKSVTFTLHVATGRSIFQKSSVHLCIFVFCWCIHLCSLYKVVVQLKKQSNLNVNIKYNLNKKRSIFCFSEGCTSRDCLLETHKSQKDNIFSQMH